MDSPTLETILTHLDALMSVGVCAVFFGMKLRKNYPWMFAYLCVRAATAVAVEMLLNGPLLASPELYTKIHFVVCYASYAVSSILLFMTCLDIYREAMAPLPALARMGNGIFRWISLASFIVVGTSITSLTSGPDLFIQIASQLMRCVGAVELSLLAFLAIAMGAIGISPRSRPFGIAVGFGVLASSDIVTSIAVWLHMDMGSSIQNIAELMGLMAIGFWMAYALMPEPVHAKVTLPAESTMYRWNEIIKAIGNRGAQVAPQPSQSFFLVDVEKIVQSAFDRTLKSKESES